MYQGYSAIWISTSEYLCDLGLSYHLKSLTGVKMIQEILSLKADINKVRRLLKNLITYVLIDTKEISSKVNGLLLDFSKNLNSIYSSPKSGSKSNSKKV